MPYLITLPFQKCEGCSSEVGLEKAKFVNFLDQVKKIVSANFQCPLCDRLFCIDCAKKDYGGDGHTLICPACQAVLKFPKTTG